MNVRGVATLTCKEVVELVTELLDDTLEPEDRVRLEQHLLVCPPCAAHIGQVRSTIALTAGLRSDAIPVEAGPVLVDLFRQWKTSKQT